MKTITKDNKVGLAILSIGILLVASMFLIAYPPVRVLGQKKVLLTNNDTIVIDTSSVSNRALQIVEDNRNLTVEIKADSRDIKKLAKIVEKETSKKVTRYEYVDSQSDKSDKTIPTEVHENKKDKRPFWKKWLGINKPKSE